MDSEDMFKSLFLLQLQKNICFELSSLTAQKHSIKCATAAQKNVSDLRRFLARYL
jgi:hypothetical protein